MNSITRDQKIASNPKKRIKIPSFTCGIFDILDSCIDMIVRPPSETRLNGDPFQEYGRLSSLDSLENLVFIYTQNN